METLRKNANETIKNLQKKIEKGKDTSLVDGIKYISLLNENINDKNSIFKKICELFEYLPLAAIINNQIICIHS